MDTQGQIVKKLWKGFGNNPLNQRTVDSMKGMLGLLPLGAGDVASGLLAADDVRRGDYVSAGLNGVGVLPYVPSMGAGLLGHTVWHGSPHKFDKFDMSKIGTGEGAQAYGHGLYFAENPKVAESYQNAGIGNIDWENAKYAGKSIQSLYDSAQRAQDLGHRTKNQALIDKANAELYYWESLLTGTHPNIARSNALDPDAGWPTLQKFVSTIDDSKFKNINFPDTSLMKVDIPDEVVPKMLDYDAPLAKQPKEVQGLIKQKLGELGYSPNKNGMRAYHIEHGGFADGTGQTLVNKFFGNSPEESSAYLRQNGIPGIRYLDGNSRGTGGTSNFVLFDDQLPRILERNGVPTGQQPWKPDELKGLFGM